MNQIERDAERNISDVASQLVATSQNISTTFQSNIEDVTQAIELTKNDYHMILVYPF